MGTAQRVEQGTVVANRYRIEGLLGAGGMAEVYRAFDLELDIPIAIKFLASSDELGPDSKRRFRREVALALRITHPNVIRLFDYGVDGQRHFLTMELVDGESLRRLLKRETRLPVGEACEIARQAALGLQAAHEAGVVHRDLKPENILISTDGRCVVADFGVAAEDEVTATSASALVGTSAYMAPEQANGEAATPKADLYALGLVLYEMVTGEVPLVGQGPVATALRREKEELPPASELVDDVPKALEAILRSLLLRDPETRGPLAGELAIELTAHATPLLPRDPTAETDPAQLDSSLRDTAAMAGDSARSSGTPRHKRKPTPRATTPKVATPQPRRKALWWGIGAFLLIDAIIVGAIVLSTLQKNRPIVLDAPAVFAIEPTPGGTLPADKQFLTPAIAAAAFRALAVELPGRLAMRSDGNSRLPGVRVELDFIDHEYVARLQLDRRTAVEGRGSAVATALGNAAHALATRWASELAPSSEELAKKTAWQAPDVEAVRNVRRAALAFARWHFDEALERTRRAKAPGFLRPLMIEVAVAGTFGPISPPLRTEIKAALADEHAPAAERELLRAILASADTEATKPTDLRDATDPLERFNRAWAMAYAGRFDEAYAEAERLGSDPTYGGLGWRLAFDFARYYDDDRESEMARQLTLHLPEEPAPWIELGKSLVRRDDLDGGEAAFSRARAVGATDDELRDAEAQLAIARFDLDTAARLGRQLVTSARDADRVAGHQTLFAVEMLRGQFAAANARAPQLVSALAASITTDSPNDALELAQDALARGENQLAARFLDAAAQVAAQLGDHEFAASATTKLLAVDRLTGRIDDARFNAGLEAEERKLRALGISQNAREYATFARLLIELGQKHCAALRTDVASRLATRPLVVVELARCELAEKAPERALARLTAMFVGHGRRNYPWLAVERELLLGEALTLLGRKDEARRHLQRVVSLWSHAADHGEVGRAQRLLEAQ